MINLLIEKIDKFYHRPKILNFFKDKNIDFFIDIGGFEGSYSNLFLKKVSKIYIFEPQKKYFNLLKLKFKSKKKVKIFNFALGQKNMESVININFLESTSSLSKINTSSKWYLFKKFIFRNRTIKEKQKTKVKKLDSIKEISKIKKISLIKIDTEGFEINVLKGSQKTLEKTKYLLVEFHENNMYKNYNENKIDTYIKNKNFIFLKKFKFPFIPFSDRIYLNSKFLKNS
jgi:FkbM family methyltransferase